MNNFQIRGNYVCMLFKSFSPFVSDKLRERRNKAVERIKILGFTQLVLSIMAIAVGIGTLIVASREPMGFPVFNPGPIIAGFLVTQFQITFQTCIFD